MITLGQFFFPLSDICIKSGEYDLVERDLIEYKNKFMNSDNPILRVEIYNKLLEIYLNKNDSASIDKLLEDIKVFIYEYNEKEILLKTEQLFFLASYYYIDIDRDKSKNYLRCGLELKNINN